MNDRFVAIAAIVALAGCAARSALAPNALVPNATRASASEVAALRATDAVPPGYKCLPSKLPTVLGARPSLAYIDACAVASAPRAANLRRMAVALMSSDGSGFSSYCTGTPIRYDAATKIGFVVTAAHCVVGGRKAADAFVTAGNVTTFASSGDAAYLYQGTPAQVSARSDLTGQIQAVYVYRPYCRVPAFAGGGCADLAAQNGDVAVLKIRAFNGRALGVMPQVRLAPKTLALRSGAFVMALGYGANTTSTPDDNTLYYVDYQYFANDRYRGESSEASLMNGYRHGGNFYSIVCQGDSGGPDLFWDGTHWDLVGAHSWGPVPCGVWGATYHDGYDVSADLRGFHAWIAAILAKDRSATGCARLGAQYVCVARRA